MSCTTRNQQTGQSLTILSWNIHHGRGVDGEIDLMRIADLITDSGADLVALQEVDRHTERTGRRDLIAELAALTGMQFAFGKNIDYQGGDYGNAILSRHPILSSTNHHYRMLRSGEQRGLLRAHINWNNRELIFMSTHLDYRPDPAERLSNVSEIHTALENLGDRPVFIAGDFNDLPDREVHQAMKQGFTDAWEMSGGNSGYTYSSEAPEKRIDYVFFNQPNDWTPVHAEVPASPASDHLPVLIRFQAVPR